MLMTATGNTPTFIHTFEYTPGGGDHTCTACWRPFRAHITAVCYPTGTVQVGQRLTGGQVLCLDCLTDDSPLVETIAGLNHLADAAAGHDHILSIAAQIISQMRREAHDLNTATVAREAGLTPTPPADVTVTATELCTDAELRVRGHLYGGQPRVQIVDFGGWCHTDTDVDEAREIAKTISDIAELAAHL